jgi:MSHA biogenesis protein MshL
MRIYVEPVTMQTRLFQVNYLAGKRSGRADVRVSSGSIQTTTAAAPGGTPPAPGSPTTPAGPATTQSLESSRVTTSSDNDFWNDIQTAIRTIIGTEGGRTAVVNPNAGVVMVRAMPKELREVEHYLKTMSLVVERQVMLEAKIIEVTLTDQFSSGINWAAFRTNPNSRFAAGVVGPDTALRTQGSVANPNVFIDPSAPTVFSPDPLTGLAGSVGAVGARLLGAATLPGAIFGLAFQTGSFAALLNFLETQGTVHVLSSPRIAALNNQKAVIKVGTDDFFVTNVTTTTVPSTIAGVPSTVSPTITTQPFFSGIALDVTPQIDDSNNIILHIHPQVSTVVERNKVVDLGNLGQFRLPLASSSINETDTIVRVQDGNIVAIGGLMRQETVSDRSQVPELGDQPGIGALFRQRGTTNAKSELVILIKPTIVHSDRNWQEDLADTRDRIRGLEPRPTK